MNTDWKHVTTRHPCPVCGRPNREHQSQWCSITQDGEVACCMFVESDRRLRNGGYLHRLREPTKDRKPVVRQRRRQELPAAINWTVLAAAYVRMAQPKMVAELAAQLAVRVESLTALQVGWDGEAWTFPMQRPDGVIVGMRRRLPSGKKLAVRGGHEGLFVPADLNGQEPLFICEGPTDCAAVHGLGLSVFGRPNCNGAVQYCVAMSRGRRVVLIPDHDEPGQNGAQELVGKLAGVALSCRTVLPPVKDAREWIQSGLTREELLGRVEC